MQRVPSPIVNSHELCTRVSLFFIGALPPSTSIAISHSNLFFIAFFYLSLCSLWAFNFDYRRYLGQTSGIGLIPGSPVALVCSAAVDIYLRPVCAIRVHMVLHVHSQCC